MTTTQSWTEETVDVEGVKIQMLKGGSGAPLVVLHGAGGNPGWQDYHQALSQHYTVYAPSHPGYDGSDSPDWVRTINDVAHFELGLMRHLGIDRPTLMGFSMGGWIAAEIAAMSPHDIRGMVLVNAVGIKPEVGEIAEMLMVPPETTQKLAFYDISKAPDLSQLTQEEQEARWRNREMASRPLLEALHAQPQLASVLAAHPSPCAHCLGTPGWGSAPQRRGNLPQRLAGLDSACD